MEDTKKVSKILIIKNSRVLLLFSKKLKKYHLPGGHVREDENFLNAVKRELFEETGIRLFWDPILVYKKTNFALYRKVYKYYDPVFVKLSPEHENFVWANIKEAHRYPICDFTKRDIYHLQKHWIDFRGKNKNAIEEQLVDNST